MPQHPVLMGMVKPPAAGGGGLDIHDEQLVCYVDAGDSGSYGGSGTTWTDLSTEGNDHTWDTAPTHTSGASGYFNVTPGQDTTGTTTNFSTGASTWTVEVWAYFDTLSGFQGLWWLGNNSSNEGLWCGHDGSLIYVETSNGTQIYSSGISTATWYSIVVTYDGTNIEIFENNVSQVSSAWTANVTFGDFRLCTSNAAFNDTFDGRIAAAIVYSDELTSGERGTNYTEFTSRY